MEHSDFCIGMEFFTETGRWRCTGIGTRVIVAISLEPHEIVSVEYQNGKHVESHSITDDPGWFNGPPYAVVEHVFDEHAQDPGCSVEYCGKRTLVGGGLHDSENRISLNLYKFNQWLIE